MPETHPALEPERPRRKPRPPRILRFTPRPAPAGSGALLDRWLLAALARSLAGVPLRLELGGAEATASPRPPVATLAIGDRVTALGLLLDPEMQFGEAYRAGRAEVEGDLVSLLEALDERPPGRLGPFARWLRWPNSLRRSRSNVHRHYDLGNDFYRLWLDEQLVYTCAYFPEPELDLEAAQVAKMDHVCRKLSLAPGETVVEAGCGWGALALHMARSHGVRVRAYNVSSEQIAWARARARSEGLEDRVAFVEEDYRKITERCDVFVSVGMLEHVGPENYAGLARVIDRCLDPGRGRGLLHFIGRARPRPLSAWIRRRIFPGAYPPSLAEVFAGVIEPAGLVALDVENLRLHYARTLQHWLARFEARREEVTRRFDEPFARAWRLYLAGSQAAFATGRLHLFQVSFARPALGDQPWTRAHLYAEA